MQWVRKTHCKKIIGQTVAQSEEVYSMEIKQSIERQEELKKIYKSIYQSNSFEPWRKSYHRLERLMLKYEKARSKTNKLRDEEKVGWYRDQKIIGTTLYVDLFSVDLDHFINKLDYFKDLGVTFIHFMPLLQGREGENDGGYAVMDYKSIDGRFGDFKTFQKIINRLHKEDMFCCVDFVVNHTAKEHEWAQLALQGEKKYMDMYFMFDSDVIPKAYEETLPEVFPKVSPGNFNYYEEIDRYVMTSFYEFQWDLNYKNPLVFEKIIDILLFLANKGIDMIRLDAIPFMWKELGTTCRNLPTIHRLLKMCHLILQEVAPSVALLGEAIVEAEEIVKYYGDKESECDVMYNAPLMVNIWNSLATRDATLLKVDLNRLQAPKDRVWINYARCHDDIGWGFNEEALIHMGLSPFEHKQYLIKFFEGSFEGSFSMGELYEFNPEDLDARNCGTMASLCGVEKALVNKDVYQLELAIKRMKLINGLLMAMSGLPLIYSGDEIAALNNHNYKKDLKKQHDSRWLHRQNFDWSIYDHLEHEDNHVNRDIFMHLKKLIEVRKTSELFNGKSLTYSLELHHKEVLGTIKTFVNQPLICLYNFSEDRQFVMTKPISDAIHELELEDILQGKTIDLSRTHIEIGPYEFLWLKSKAK